MRKNKNLTIHRTDQFETRGLSSSRRIYLRYRKTGMAGVMISGVALAFFLQLILANGLATRGGEINELEKQREQLNYEITRFDEELSRLQSLPRIKEIATQKLGMTYNPNQFEYFDSLEYAFDE